MGNSAFSNYLLIVSFMIPIFIATIAGIAWAGVNWKKSTTPAIACVAACAVLLLFSCIFPALHVWLPRMFVGQNAGPDMFTRIIWTDRVITISSHLCTAACFGGLIFAVFAGRAVSFGKKEKKKRDRDEDEDDDDRPPKKSREDDDAVTEKPAKKRPRDED